MPTFPALDEEPPPRPVWRVLLKGTTGLVPVAAGVVGGGRTPVTGPVPSNPKDRYALAWQAGRAA